METNDTICVVGCGYVGFPLAINLALTGRLVWAVDNNPVRVRECQETDFVDGISVPHEILTISSELPKNCAAYIICVQTPAYAGVPDYAPLVNAVVDVREVMSPSSIVIVESTVAPDTMTGMLLSHIRDRFPEFSRLVYSPERINPGPGSLRKMRKEAKLVASPNTEALDAAIGLYRPCFTNIIPLDDFRVAELAKCFENFQRDMNIAMMNELSLACLREGIDYRQVVHAVRSKSNFLDFHSGLVGGHCIPVDPYYLSEWYASVKGTGVEETLPYESRTCNESFIEELAEIIAERHGTDARILIWGVTYKPDVDDTRNSGSCSLCNELRKKGCSVVHYDPRLQSGAPTITPKGLYNVVIGTVSHDLFGYRDMPISRIVPVSEDCTFYNIGGFNTTQMLGMKHIVNL